MEMEAALVGSPPASAWAAPDKRCALPSTLLTSEHRSANDPLLSFELPPAMFDVQRLLQLMSAGRTPGGSRIVALRGTKAVDP